VFRYLFLLITTDIDIAALSDAPRATKMPNMNLVLPQLAALTLCVCFALAPTALNAQNQAATPSQTAKPGPSSQTAKPGPPSQTAKPGPAEGKPQFTEDQMKEMIDKLRDRVGNAANQVIGRIQKEETDLRIKFSYLRKPDRLDPNTYASRDEIAQWRGSVQQLKEKEDLLERLYADADQDLGNALIQQKVNAAIADQIRNELLKSFPWSTIKRKNELMREFIAEHFELLAFYDKNWGSWRPGREPGTPTFDNRQLAAAFDNLKEKINTTGLQIEDQYKVMVQ
jgi:hypothetical protein